MISSLAGNADLALSSSAFAAAVTLSLGDTAAPASVRAVMKFSALPITAASLTSDASTLASGA